MKILVPWALVGFSIQQWPGALVGRMVNMGTNTWLQFIISIEWIYHQSYPVLICRVVCVHSIAPTPNSSQPEISPGEMHVRKKKKKTQ